MRRPTLTIYSLAGLAAFLVLAQSYALACRCPEAASASTFYKKAHAVVSARVVEVRVNPDGNGWTATIEVSQAWKARVPKTISVSTSTTCGFDFRQGAEYVFYLFQTEDGGYYTSKCVGNLLLTDAGSRLSWLKQHGSVTSIEEP